MLELHKILAPTDFSPHADGALRFACALAEKFGSSLHLLHVLPEVIPVVADLSVAATLPPEYYQEAEDQARSSLTKALNPSWGTPFDVKSSVRWGNAVDTILDYAREQAIDLIVISTHGRTGLSHVLLGSVAERIVRETPCPVVTLRDHTRSERVSQKVVGSYESRDHLL